MVKYEVLSPAEREFFVENGYVKIEQGISPENVERFIGNVWTRLGWDKDDKSTWMDSYHAPRHREIPTKEYMPRVYQAACELVGGEDRLDHGLFTKSGDSLIINTGDEATTDVPQHPRDTDNWHIDGDWFEHFLDSGEQGLVVICLYTDVVDRGGPTLICPAALPAVIKNLYEHPGGGWDNKAVFREAMKDEENFVYLTGKAGDVFLAHPFMPHSRSRNYLRNFRAITNPPCTLKEPMNFNRPDGDYSLNEQLILRKLGVSSLPDWHITVPRTRFPPRTQAGKMAKVQAELERMLAHAEKTGEPVDSVHLRGEALEQWKLNDFASTDHPAQHVQLALPTVMASTAASVKAN